MQSQFNRQQYQQGAALFVSLVFLLILTVLSGVLLSNAGMGMKVVSAISDRVHAEHQLEGDLNALVAHKDLQTHVGGMQVNGHALNANLIITGLSGTITHHGDATCARSYSASSNNAIVACRHVVSELKQPYGKFQSTQVVIAAGIEQPTL